MELALAALDIYLGQIYIMVLWDFTSAFFQLIDISYLLEYLFGLMSLLYFLNKMLDYSYACL